MCLGTTRLDHCLLKSVVIFYHSCAWYLVYIHFSEQRPASKSISWHYIQFRSLVLKLCGHCSILIFFHNKCRKLVHLNSSQLFFYRLYHPLISNNRLPAGHSTLFWHAGSGSTRDDVASRVSTCMNCSLGVGFVTMKLLP